MGAFVPINVINEKESYKELWDPKTIVGRSTNSRFMTNLLTTITSDVLIWSPRGKIEVGSKVRSKYTKSCDSAIFILVVSKW